MMDPEVKKQRMLEKAMRMPINNVVLKIQDRQIDIKDLFKKIELKVREKNNGKISTR